MLTNLIGAHLLRDSLHPIVVFLRAPFHNSFLICDKIDITLHILLFLLFITMTVIVNQIVLATKVRGRSELKLLRLIEVEEVVISSPEL